MERIFQVQGCPESDEGPERGSHARWDRLGEHVVVSIAHPIAQMCCLDSTGTREDLFYRTWWRGGGGRGLFRSEYGGVRLRYVKVNGSTFLPRPQPGPRPSGFVKFRNFYKTTLPSAFQTSKKMSSPGFWGQSFPFSPSASNILPAVVHWQGIFVKKKEEDFFTKQVRWK